MGIKRSELPDHVQKLVDEVERKSPRRSAVDALVNATNVRARGRIANPGMNKIETDYHEHLHGRLLAGEIVWLGFEAITLKLGRDLRYTIDFFVMLRDGALQAHEVKGPYEREDSKIKRRITARIFPWPLYLVTREGDGWKLTLVKP